MPRASGPRLGRGHVSNLPWCSFLERDERKVRRRPVRATPRKGGPGPIPAVSNPSLSYHDNRRGDVSRSFGEKSTITLIARSRRNARAFRAATVGERLVSGGGSTRSRSRL